MLVEENIYSAPGTSRTRCQHSAIEEAVTVLWLGQFLEIRHSDVIRTPWAVNQNTEHLQWIGDCQHMQHGTVILKDYLPQWNKPIRILSLCGDNVYGYDFKWRDVLKSESQNEWIRTIFLCSNCADFWAWSVVLWF